jgi:hypothetical protein
MFINNSHEIIYHLIFKIIAQVQMILKLQQNMYHDK